MLLPVVYGKLPATDSPVLPCGSVFGDLGESAAIRHFKQLCRQAKETKKRVPRCTHLLALDFTFIRTGETIKMCPDCTTFDAHRKQVLRTGQVDKASTGFIELWEASLKVLASRLSSAYDRVKLEGGYQLCNDCGEMLVNKSDVCRRHDTHYTHLGCDFTINRLDLSDVAYQIPLNWLKGTLSHLAGGEEDSRIGGRVNTTGLVCDNVDGEDEVALQHSSSRDYREYNVYSAEQEREPKTLQTCLWCFDEFWERKGTDFCPETAHRQRFHDFINAWTLRLENKNRLKEKLDINNNLRSMEATQ
jgi:predicted RNA-binding Zn-ribbon protein involved in translation (DUF1610 family)